MSNMGGLILPMLTSMLIEITVQALNDKRSDMSPPPACPAVPDMSPPPACPAVPDMSPPPACPAVPGLLEAPVVGKVTHHTVELSWRPSDHTPSAGRLHYCVQEEEKGRGFTDVYK